jgi:hypothetical protein
MRGTPYRSGGPGKPLGQATRPRKLKRATTKLNYQEG